jgi:hypothetical protein
MADYRQRKQPVNKRKQKLGVLADTYASVSSLLKSNEKTEWFDRCWSAAPKKEGKSDARKAFDKRVETQADAERFLAGVNEYARVVKDERREMVKHGKTVFNNIDEWIEKAEMRATAKPKAKASALPPSDVDRALGLSDDLERELDRALGPLDGKA